MQEKGGGLDSLPASVDEGPSAFGILLAVDVAELLLREVLQELPLASVIQKPRVQAPETPRRHTAKHQCSLAAWEPRL